MNFNYIFSLFVRRWERGIHIFGYPSFYSLNKVMNENNSIKEEEVLITSQDEQIINENTEVKGE